MESKLSVKNMILKELRKSGDPRKVRKLTKSMSLFALCLNEYIDERLSKLEEIDDAVAKRESSVMRLEKRRSALKKDNNSISAENRRLASDNQRLTEEVKRKSDKVQGLDSKLLEISGRGVSLEILPIISKLVEKSGDKLLDQLENLEVRNNLEEECLVIEKRRTSLERQIGKLQNRRNKLIKEVDSENRRLEEVNIAVMDAENKLQFFKEKTIAAIEETKKEGLSCIEKVAENVRNLEANVSEDVIKTVDDVGALAQQKIGNNAGKAICHMQEITENFEATLSSGKEMFLNITKSLHQNLGEFADLQKEIGRLGNSVLYGQTFLGIMNSVDYLSKMPPSIVADILFRISLWCRIKFPGMLIHPSKEIVDREIKLNPFSFYKVDVLCEFLSDGIRNQGPNLTSV